MKKEKNINDAERFAVMTAGKQGWELNPDKDFLRTILQGLADNYNRYGYYLCPCRDTGGSREKDSDILCPCDYNIPDQEEYGHCYCALFFSKPFLESGRPPGSIPERRPEKE